MSQPSQAELFARAFQSQVARNPGAACLTLPILRELACFQSIAIWHRGFGQNRFIMDNHHPLKKIPAAGACMKNARQTAGASTNIGLPGTLDQKQGRFIPSHLWLCTKIGDYAKNVRERSSPHSNYSTNFDGSKIDGRYIVIQGMMSFAFGDSNPRPND